MKLLTPAIAVIFLVLLLGASPLGYCYTNTMAQKTTDDLSEYGQMTQIGMTPGAQIALASSAIIGSGVLAGIGTGVVAGVGTYYVISASSMAATGATAIELIEYSNAAFAEALACQEFANSALATGTAVLGGTMSPGFFSIVAPYLIPLGIGLCVAVVVILITAAGIFVVWSYT